MKKYNRVYVEITNICNRSCSFCPSTKREPRRITTDEFRTVCERLLGVTDYLYLHIMGEPLTVPNLAELIAFGKEYGYKISITTNGTLLKTRGESLLSALPYKVNVSLHSFEVGDREDYLDYINSCIDFADRASRLGILTVLRLWNRGFDEGRNIDTVALLEEKFGKEWVRGARGARIRDKLHLEYGDRFSWPDTSAEDLGGDVFCHGLGDHFGILVDGGVVPCCLDHDGDVRLGNIYEEPISDILSSPRAIAIAEGFQHKIASEELCRRCGYARRFKL